MAKLIESTRKFEYSLDELIYVVADDLCVDAASVSLDFVTDYTDRVVKVIAKVSEEVFD